MNPNPKYTVVHMRARMAGLAFAECRNCMYMERDIDERMDRWCLHHVEDPYAGQDWPETVCEQHEPDADADAEEK